MTKLTTDIQTLTTNYSVNENGDLTITTSEGGKVVSIEHITKAEQQKELKDKINKLINDLGSNDPAIFNAAAKEAKRMKDTCLKRGIVLCK